MASKTVDEAAFLAAVQRLGGTVTGASDWLDEARRIGLDECDTTESLAALCVEDERDNEAAAVDHPAVSLEPVTVGGWYERTDGTYGRYLWVDGRVKLCAVVATREACAEYDRRTLEMPAAE